MKQSMAILTAFVLGGATFALSTNSKATPTKETISSVAEHKVTGETIEGFLLEKPKFDAQSKSWQLKISVRKNEKLQNTSIVISLPMSRSAQITRYYQGDYVKLANVSLGGLTSKDATAADDSSEDLGSETSSSYSSVQ
jgi:hypothetical protein